MNKVAVLLSIGLVLSASACMTPRSTFRETGERVHVAPVTPGPASSEMHYDGSAQDRTFIQFNGVEDQATEERKRRANEGREATVERQKKAADKEMTKFWQKVDTQIRTSR